MEFQLLADYSLLLCQKDSLSFSIDSYSCCIDEKISFLRLSEMTLNVFCVIKL